MAERPDSSAGTESLLAPKVAGLQAEMRTVQESLRQLSTAVQGISASLAAFMQREGRPNLNLVCSVVGVGLSIIAGFWWVYVRGEERRQLLWEEHTKLLVTHTQEVALAESKRIQENAPWLNYMQDRDRDELKRAVGDIRDALGRVSALEREVYKKKGEP